MGMLEQPTCDRERDTVERSGHGNSSLVSLTQSSAWETAFGIALWCNNVGSGRNKRSPHPRGAQSKRQCSEIFLEKRRSQ
jgi:hypothetical protein